MIYHATKIADAALTDAGLKHNTDSVGEKISYVEAGFSGDNSTIKIRLISADDDNDAKFLTENIAKFPESKLAVGYELMNELNNKFRFAKFTLSQTGEVTAEYDIPLKTSDDCLGNIIVEIFIRFSKIVDEAYPLIMKAIWA